MYDLMLLRATTKRSGPSLLDSSYASAIDFASAVRHGVDAQRPYLLREQSRASGQEADVSEYQRGVGGYPGVWLYLDDRAASRRRPAEPDDVLRLSRVLPDGRLWQDAGPASAAIYFLDCETGLLWRDFLVRQRDVYPSLSVVATCTRSTGARPAMNEATT